MLGVTAVLAANVLELVDCFRQGAVVDWLTLLCGGATAAVVGVFSIRLIEKLVQKDRFKWFGCYCLVVGAAVIAAAVFEELYG